MKPCLVVIAGPTASGKTALAIALAQHLKAEIFSADARQFYRQMDIGTAKPTAAEQATVKHHFIDTLNPEDAYTAGRYSEDLREALTDYFKEHRYAIVVGGSGFYIKAAVEGLDDLPPTPNEIRSKYDQLRSEHGLIHLQQLLEKKDPQYFAEVDTSNPQRVQRALEAIEVSGKPFSELRKSGQKTVPWEVKAFVLNPPREQLYQRINARVDAMIADGLIGEVRRLYPLKDLNALQTVGYSELFSHFDGKLSLQEAIDKIKQHTRNYAKRQMTWFRKQEEYIPISDQKIDVILRHLKTDSNV